MPCVNHPEVSEALARCARCEDEFCPDCLVSLHERRYCAVCKAEALRDIQSGAVGPHTLVLAGWWRRFVAMFVDGLVQSIVILPAYVVFVVLPMVSMQGHSGVNPEAATPLFIVGMLAYYAVAVGCPIIYEALFLTRRGQTPGKMLLGLKVVAADGTDIRSGAAWKRACGRFGLGLLCGIGALIDYLAPLFTEERTTLHDLLAETRVIRIS